MKIIKNDNDIILAKENNNYVIIDDLNGTKLTTIHTDNWSCSKKEKEEYLNKIFKAHL